jgi:hypothetical protein
MECREIPTPKNVRQLLIKVARYEFTVKLLGALYSLHSGVPRDYFPFFSKFSVNQLHDLYVALSVTPLSVLGMISECDDTDANYSRVLGYMKTFIGNLEQTDLRNFLRYVTGSSVRVDEEITVTFNKLSGLARRPVSHTCSNVLELPVTYKTYPEFAQEFLSVLRDEFAWPMDFC